MTYATPSIAAQLDLHGRLSEDADTFFSIKRKKVLE